MRPETAEVPHQDQRIVLSAFSRALNREAHVLKDHPNLVWQQLYNRLSWDNRVPQALLSAELECRDDVWLRRLVPIAESSWLLRTMTGHAPRTITRRDEEDTVLQGVNDCDVSPDGRLIISGGNDGKLLVHEVATGNLVSSLQNNFIVKACAFDPTGRRIVLIDYDGLKVLDARTYERCWEAKIVSTTSGLDMSPDGGWIVAGVGDTVKVWDAESGRIMTEFHRHEAPVETCAVTPDGYRVVSGSRDTTIRVWDPRSAEEEAVFRGHTGWVLGCSLSPNGDFIISASSDGTVRVWDLHSAKIHAILEGHIRGVNACCVTHDGKTIVSAGRDGTVRLWDLLHAELRAILKGHGGGVTCCDVSADNCFVISGGGDGTVRVWGDLQNLHQSYPTEETPNTKSEALSLWESRADIGALSSNGHWMLTGEGDQLRIWDAASGAMHSEIKGRHTLNRCAIGPDDSWLVTADSSKGLTMRAVPGGDELSRRELSANDLAIAYQWMPRPRHANPNYDVGFDINACAPDPSGRWVATASDDGAIRLWTSSPLKVDVTLGTHADVALDCTLTPDGSQVVSTGKDGIVRVWDIVPPGLKETFEGHQGPVPCLAVSPDGLFVVSGGADKVLRMWEIPGGKLRATLEGHQGRVSACAVNPDGRLIASVADDSTLRVWCALTGHQLALLPLSGITQWVLFDPSKPVIWTNSGLVIAVELLGQLDEPPAIMPERRALQSHQEPPPEVQTSAARQPVRKKSWLSRFKKRK